MHTDPEFQCERRNVTVYVLAQLKFKDRAAYDRYQAAFGGVFGAFEGAVLSADTRPKVLEGHWEGDKVVLLSFPDEAAWRAWAESPGYQDISRDRVAGADCTVLLLKGVGA
ncbi:DUF1330 domain-containing protein [Ramlibacter tataouinensis]|uniref:DUF1330 domain-containing protein n=1 Tax=Ramlibacter tataouinensis TaxID=94132 RepID=UPI0022F3956E|nr:DUF1330 domain-containing protein [Ramlibacter tataouinensis]WBX99920.1 DUF1330 domain-containing protein [Ramlibacter tataouinensis]